MDITKDIYIISRFTHAFFARELAALDVTMAQFPFVIGIVENDGISQEKLSAKLSMGKSTTAAVVKELEKKNLIIRNVDQADRRNFQLHATKKAIMLYPEIRKVIDRCNTIISDGLSPEELSVFCSLLSRVRHTTENALKVNK
ncbi:MAG: MarR family transcriptional regulator [Lentisphaeria bacterium]|nr:MarR family transcriptional regulator [Lentisphaeria bacterium]